MHLRFHRSALSILACGLILPALRSNADTFSWANVTYAPSATTAQQPTSLGNGGGGNTVRIQFTLNNGATFLPTATVQSPAVDSYSTNNTYYTSGGNATTNRYLQIGTNLVNTTTTPTTIGSVTVSLFFAQPVANFSCSFFDVDINGANGGSYVDQIRSIVGISTTSTPVYLTSLTGSTANTVSGSGSTYAVTATANNANNLGAANATATFGSTPLTQISFTYGDNYTGTAAHGTAQIIGLSDLSFTTVPEPGTVAMIALGLFGTAGVALRRRRA